VMRNIGRQIFLYCNVANNRLVEPATLLEFNGRPGIASFTQRSEPFQTRVIIWRKLVGVEPTCDTECPTLVLKTRPSTGQD
jgi:hypothetical protein